MARIQSLRVLMPEARGQRWSCHSCGECCRSLVGHLTHEECARLDAQEWEKELGIAPYVRVGRNAMLNRRDGACVFLDDENRCRIHAKYGEQDKPFACRIFPFSVRAVSRGWQASFRFDCPSSTASKGKPMGHYRPWLEELVQELSHRPSPASDRAGIIGKKPATKDELETVAKHYDRWFKQGDPKAGKPVPFNDRLVGAARITATLHSATLKNVRDRRFAELLDVLFGSSQSVCEPKPASATVRQRRMLRQLAFAHGEHVTLDELRAGPLGKMKKRWQQLKKAQRFLVGRGEVPMILGIQGAATFDSVEAVLPASEGLIEVEDLLRRYIHARLQGRSVYGAGYYGWPVFSGMVALLLSVAVIGWLSRVSAATGGRSALTLADVQLAVGIVDRAASRLPVLGTGAERARCAYLVNNDGIARLLADFAIMGDAA